LNFLQCIHYAVLGVPSAVKPGIFKVLSGVNREGRSEAQEFLMVVISFLQPPLRSFAPTAV